jgi:uncharacterized protein
MIKTVLITGGTGLIGKPLTQALLQKGYSVHHLSRSVSSKIHGVKNFRWNLSKGEIDPACIDGVDSIIHLAGEGIAARPWTSAQKKELIESRTESIRLLYKLIKNSTQHQVREVISASGIGIYGNRGDELLSENSAPGDDFLSRCCIEWEKAVDEIATENIRIVKLRTGVVLSAQGGALAQMDKPIKAGVGAILGSGKQWMPWIHIQDIVSLYIHVLENPGIQGAFNTATASPHTNKEFTETLAKVLDKKIWLPAVPAFALRIILGEMRAIVLNSTKTSAEKILTTGFNFTFESLEDALTDIYAQKTA